MRSFFLLHGSSCLCNLLYFETAVIMCFCTALHTDFHITYSCLFLAGSPTSCSNVMSFIITVLLECRGTYSLEKPRNHSLKCHGFIVDFYFHVSQPDLSPAPQTLSTVRVAKFQWKIGPSFPRYPVAGFVSEWCLSPVLIVSPFIRDNSDTNFFCLVLLQQGAWKIVWPVTPLPFSCFIRV